MNCKMTETQFQSAVCKLLDLYGVKYFHIPNEGRRTRWEQAQFKKLGGKAGVADLAVMMPEAKMVFLEIKTQKGRQSPSQKAWQEQVELLSFKYLIVRPDDLETLIQQLREYQYVDLRNRIS